MQHRSHKSVIPSFHRAQTVVPLAFWYSCQCFSAILTTVLSTASSSLLNSCPKDRMWLSFARTIFMWCISAKLRHFWDVLHKPQFRNLMKKYSTIFDNHFDDFFHLTILKSILHVKLGSSVECTHHHPTDLSPKLCITLPCLLQIHAVIFQDSSGIKNY